MKRLTIKTLVVLAAFAIAHCAQAYTYCQYRKPGGLKCGRIAVNGGLYCKEHCGLADAKTPAERKAMDYAAREAAKARRMSPSSETQRIGFAGSETEIQVTADGRVSTSRQDDKGNVNARTPQTNEEKMEWHFMMALKYMKAAIEDAEDRGKILGASMEAERRNDIDAAMHGKSLDGKHIYAP